MQATIQKPKTNRIYQRLNYELNRNLRSLGAKKWFETEMGRLYLPKPWVSDTMLKNILGGMYEMNEIALLRQFLNPDDVVIELGSGIGFLAKHYCTVSPKSHVAIEASPFICEILKTNVVDFKNLQIINAVARRSKGDNTFYVYEDFWASSLIPLHLEDSSYKLCQEIAVPSIDLDNLIAEREATFLICDIEGGEKELFNSFEINVPKILLELHWDFLEFSDAMAILNHLKERKYDLYGHPGFLMAVKS